jgi:hypothetical protein
MHNLGLSTKQKVIDLVDLSFLEEDTKLQYLNFYEAKLTRMNYSFKKLMRS